MMKYGLQQVMIPVIIVIYVKSRFSTFGAQKSIYQNHRRLLVLNADQGEHVMDWDGERGGRSSIG